MLLKTHVTSLESSDKHSLLVACGKQQAESFMQELKELKAAINISIKLKSPIRESLQDSLGFINAAMIKLKTLDPNNKKYAEKFTGLFGGLAKKQRFF